MFYRANTFSDLLKQNDNPQGRGASPRPSEGICYA